MSAHGGSIALENATSHDAWRASRGSVPRSGDVLASERTARADVYAISVVPAPAHKVVRRYPEAIERVRELARQLGVDAWYTADQTHYAPIVRHRPPSEG